MFIDELELAGHRLFRHRSYVFFILIPLAAAAIYSRDHYLWNSQRVESIYEVVCFLISMLGLVVRMLSIGYAQPGTSGRNTAEQIADNLNTAGMYSICRHPLYLGNFLMALGLFLFTGSYWFAIIGAMLYVLVYERIIITEEDFLLSKFGASFKEWTKTVPCVIPRFARWRKGEFFSLKAAIRGEVYGFTAIVTVFFILKIAKDSAILDNLQFDYYWLAFFSATIPVFFIIRFLRKHTKVLDSA
ncbi:isoprenylcysteine carboxylmethyltransferase family protein [bacterium]|nr:isoprenylcysteine carboxylmethyltransferase family protein [bacterium]